jgi:polysaccharide pyruvyl transferase WcaK-like protein
MAGKILFTGYYGFNNFGDDLFGLACVNGLKGAGRGYLPIILSPPVSGIEAKYLVPRYLGGLYNGRGFLGKLLRLLFMVYGCLRYKDVVLSGGSVISSGASFNIRFIQYHLARLGLCRLSAIGISVGPFYSDKDRDYAKKFINRLSYLCVRDEASVQECSSLDVRIDVNLYNDLAACAPLPSMNEVSKKGRILGVSVCRFESIVGGDTEKEDLRNRVIFEGVSEFSIKHNFEVRILILNGNPLVGDVEISKELHGYLASKGIAVTISNYVNPMESLNEISECRVFFSVRLHGAISAYLLGVPFALVEYHKKCKDFLDYIGVDQECRISAGERHEAVVVSCLERTIQGCKEYRIRPEDYMENANRTFRKSPWSGDFY